MSEFEIEQICIEIDNEKYYPTREKNRKYYLENKPILQEKYKSRVCCPLCDKNVAKGSLNIHMKSKLCEKGQMIKSKLLSMCK